MNHDDTNPEMKTWIEPELEARVIAWVAGEASAFEAAELERLCGEKPELAIFKRRIEAVHGLMGEAVRPDAEPLRLSDERRAKVLAAFGAADTVPARDIDAVHSKVRTFPLPSWRKQLWIFGTAACLTLASYVAVTLSTREKQHAVTAQIVELPAVADLSSQTSEETADSQARSVAVASDVVTRRKARFAAEHSSRREAAVRGLIGGADEIGASPSGAATQLFSDEFTVNTPRLEQAEAFDAPNAPPASARSPAASPPSPWSLDLGALHAAVNGSDGKVADRSAGALAAAAKGKGASNASVAARSLSFGMPAPPLEGRAPNPETSYGYFSRGDLATGGSANLAALPSPSTTVFSEPATFGGSIAAQLPASVLNLEARTDKDQLMLGEKKVTFGIDAPGRRGPFPPGPHDLLAKESTFVMPAEPTDAELDARKRERTQAASEPEPSVAPRETSASREPVSTFSLHVSDASFRLAQSALLSGQLPDPQRIRLEEFYNAFDYRDPPAVPGEQVSGWVEQSAHPFLQQRNLVRIALKVPATGRAAGRPLNLTVLLDTSGSMEREDRAAIVRRALEELVALLGPQDRVSLVGFARQPRLLAENIQGNQAGMIVDLATHTPAEGGTNVEAALTLAGEIATRHRANGGLNRIVLLTDGAANLGNADPEALAQKVESLRLAGVAFDACGIGRDQIDDRVLEALTRRGDGRYYVLTSPEQADAGFARQLAGAFRPAAENVKVQVRFNPARVGQYRLIGFEQHRLREEDFRNDAVDAAELAAEEGAVALYQVEALPQGEGELGDVYVRFRDPTTHAMVERSWTIAHDPAVRRFEHATPSLQLAGTSALLAEKLRGGDYAQQFKLSDFTGVVTALRGHHPNEAAVQQFVHMYQQARQQLGD